MTYSMKAMMADTWQLADAAANGIYTTRADAAAHQGDYRVIIDAVNKMLDEIITPPNEFTAVIGNMSVNNMTVSVTGQYKGKPNDMAQSINQTMSQMKIITREMLDISKGNCSLLPAFEKAGRLCEEDQLTPAAIKLMQTINLLVDEAAKLSCSVMNGNLDSRSDTAQFQLLLLIADSWQN